jgi:acetyl-CoA acetyltransferase
MNYVCGVGRTKFGVLNMGLPELAYEAMFKALEDGDFSVSDLDLIYIANFLKNTR